MVCALINLLDRRGVNPGGSALGLLKMPQDRCVHGPIKERYNSLSNLRSRPSTIVNVDLDSDIQHFGGLTIRGRSARLNLAIRQRLLGTQNLDSKPFAERPMERLILVARVDFAEPREG